jgi:hypothetical protein
MQLLVNPHIFSNLILSFTGVYIFYKYFSTLLSNNRLLWGIFLISISLSAITDLLFFAGIDQLESARKIVDAEEMTLGAVCMVVASWCLIMKMEPGKILFAGTLVIGFTVFYSIIWYKVEYVSMIIKAFCILLTLTISCLGLAYRRKSALWVIFSMMFFALATKAGVINIPMHPVDINHYLMVMGVISIGKARKDVHKILF